MELLPKHSVLNLLSIAPDELNAMIERGEFPRPFEHHGASLWPRSAVINSLVMRQRLAKQSLAPQRSQAN